MITLWDSRREPTMSAEGPGNVVECVDSLSDHQRGLGLAKAPIKNENWLFLVKCVADALGVEKRPIQVCVTCFEQQPCSVQY